MSVWKYRNPDDKERWDKVGGRGGGYDTPGVRHDGSGAMTISFAPSKSAMPGVAPVKVQLPAGQKGDQGIIGPAGPEKDQVLEMPEEIYIVGVSGNDQY